MKIKSHMFDYCAMTFVYLFIEQHTSVLDMKPACKSLSIYRDEIAYGSFFYSAREIITQSSTQKVYAMEVEGF